MSMDRSPSENELKVLEEYGWQKEKDGFFGAYNASADSFPGMIRFESGQWQFYIIDCPQQVLNGLHGGCMRVRADYHGRTMYWVHFKTGNVELASGILAISKLILEDMTRHCPADE